MAALKPADTGLRRPGAARQVHLSQPADHACQPNLACDLQNQLLASPLLIGSSSGPVGHDLILELATYAGVTDDLPRILRRAIGTIGVAQLTVGNASIRIP